jgi:hypothetical protein
MMMVVAKVIVLRNDAGKVGRSVLAPKLAQLTQPIISSN